jgi:hypothetical protein
MNGQLQQRARRHRHHGVGRERPQARTTSLAAATIVYLVDDLRSADGLARQTLRRAAGALAASRRAALRRVGDAYLRLDPSAPEVARPQSPTVAGPELSEPPAPATPRALLEAPSAGGSEALEPSTHKD